MRRFLLISVTSLVLSACGAVSPGASPGSPSGASSGSPSGATTSSGGAHSGSSSSGASSSGPFVEPTIPVTTLPTAHAVGAESFLVQVALPGTSSGGSSSSGSTSGATSGAWGSSSGATSSGWTSSGASSSGASSSGASSSGTASGGATSGASSSGISGTVPPTPGSQCPGGCAPGTIALFVTAANGAVTVTCVTSPGSPGCGTGFHPGGASSSSGGCSEYSCISDAYRAPGECPVGTHASSSGSSSSGGSSSSSGAGGEVVCVPDPAPDNGGCPPGQIPSATSSGSGCYVVPSSSGMSSGGTTTSGGWYPGSSGTSSCGGTSSGGTSSCGASSSGESSSSGTSGGTSSGGTSSGGTSSGGTSSGGNTSGGNTSGGTWDGGVPAPDDARTAEALSADGKTLYTADAFRGLQVFDLSALDAPVLAGRVPLAGSPRALHLRGTQALVLLSDVVSWSQEATTVSPVERARVALWAVDETAPSAPRITAKVDLGSALLGSRLVGTVLYVVSSEGPEIQASGGWSATAVHVWSFDVAGATPRTIAHLALEPGWSIPAAELADDRITVARTGITDGSGTGFQVYDVSAGDGTLTPGASFSAEDRLVDPRAMHWDATRGVFGAFAQGSQGPGAILYLWSSPTPAVAARASRTQVAVSDLLMSGRIDGARAYGYGYAGSYDRAPQRLYVVDTTDPARPVVSDPLPMPGPVTQLEARGDRLLALGYTAPTYEAEGLSLFLVDGASALDPRILSSVAVGTEAALPPLYGDDRIRSLQVLEGEGMVAVPALSWDASGRTQVGHVALVDLSSTGLTARARLSHPGRVARVVALAGRAGQLALLSVTRLSTVDATDRASPRVRASLDLTQSALDLAFVGGNVVTLVAPDALGTGAELWTSHAPGAAPLGRVPVPGGARLHVAGTTVWVLGGTPSLTAVDVSDPARPRVRSTLDLVAASRGQGGGWGCGVEFGFVGSALVVHRTVACTSTRLPIAVLRPRTARATPGASTAAALTATLGAAAAGYHDVLVFDLATPDAPRLAARVPLAGTQASELTVAGGYAWVTHWEDDAGPAGWGRFFADRVDVATPTTPGLLSVNVPGVLVDAEPGGRLYVREPVRWEWAPDVWIQQTDVHALTLTDRGTARLVATASLPGPGWRMALAAGHAYALTFPPGPTGLLSALDGATLAVTSQQPVPTRSGGLVAAGGKLLLSHLTVAGTDDSMLLFDLASPARPSFVRGEAAPGWESSQRSVVVDGDVAYLPSGPFGVRAVSLKEAP